MRVADAAVIDDDQPDIFARHGRRGVAGIVARTEDELIHSDGQVVGFGGDFEDAFDHGVARPPAVAVRSDRCDLASAHATRG